VSLENLLWSVTEAIFRHTDPYQPEYPQETLFNVVENLFRQHMVEGGNAKPPCVPDPQQTSAALNNRLRCSGGYLCSSGGPAAAAQDTLPALDDAGDYLVANRDEYKQGRQFAAPAQAPKLSQRPGIALLRPIRPRRVGAPIGLIRREVS
jgi:hypothetical protein